MRKCLYYTTDKKYASMRWDRILFLAGPTVRPDSGEQESWRSKALTYLSEKGFCGLVVVPEFDPNNKENMSYEEIFEFEQYWLKRATNIAFWVPRSETLPGFTTNVEFGMFFKDERVSFGYPKDAMKTRYLDTLYKTYTDKHVHNSLESLLLEAGVLHCSSISDNNLLNEPKVYFTSDTHFGQRRTLELSRRPFASVKEMDKTMIDNINAVITPNDTLFHLGDFGDPTILKYLNTKRVILIVGNYDVDRYTKEHSDITNERDEYQNAIYHDYFTKQGFSAAKLQYNIMVDDVCMTLRHIYKPNDKSFQLFGHIHKLQMVKRNGLNVGVDCHDFKPIDLDTVGFYHNAITKHYDDNVFNY